MEIQEILLKQLEQYYRVTEQDKGRATTIRNWGITVWLAIVVALISGKLTVNFYQSLFVVIIPIVSFWFLESSQWAYVRMNDDRAKKLEKAIAENQQLTAIPLDYFYVSSYHKITTSKKIEAFFKSMFTSTIVSIFYCILLVTSLLFIVILF